ncbi:MAG: LysE family transporter [Burkholderiales bacterium]|nr:LysE family transporter [Burkholderiales bacterium]
MFEFIHITATAALLVIGIIAGIGPQNLNLISHAIRKNYTYHVAATCFLADIVLILIGCIGLMQIDSKIIITIINIIGIIFLSFYLIIKLKDLNKPHHIKFDNNFITKKVSILRAIGLTWLNPLVFLDTIVIIGGASTHYSGIQHIAFTTGAILGDFIWIFGVAYLARRFSHQLNKAIVWKIIDISTITLISYIIYTLSISLIN